MKTYLWSAAWIVCLVFVVTSSAAEEAADEEAKRLGAAVLKVALKIVPPKDDSLREMLPRDIDQRFAKANEKSRVEGLNAILAGKSKWEGFRNKAISNLEQSLHLPAEKVPLNLEVMKLIPMDGYQIRKVIYDSRPNWQVTGTLYIPMGNRPNEGRPAILISHSHHSPKTQGELQDLGAIWARAGCYVLVPDHVGHGERRQHPYASADDYPEKFQVGRQDYFFRYNTSLQLYACGESLMGWMVWDLMCGLDVLRAQAGVDPTRVALMGGVAGGGDPAAVTAALDDRARLLVPFNFGGPQPETKFPLPADAEETFDYAGSGSWESTRNLHRSAADGFLPWVIVGSFAPHGVIHAHEFTWDRWRDPVWMRYEKIFDLYEAGDKLDFTYGYGGVKLSEAEASHCGNIGPVHRANIHRYLGVHWKMNAGQLFALDAERKERLATMNEVRHTPQELACLKEDMKLTPLREVAATNMRKCTWQDVLPNVGPYEVRAEVKAHEEIPGIVAERLLLSGERDIRVPVLLIRQVKPKGKQPVTILFVDEDKSEYALDHADELGKRLKDSALCFVDVRGMGLSAVKDDHSRKSYNTSLAASELMLGEPLLAGQLRDLRSAIAYLRTRDEFSGIELVADGIGKEGVNAADVNVERPLELEQPKLANITAPMLVLLACYFEEKPLKAHVRGGLVSYRSLLDSQFVHVPLDAIIPGAIPAGDVEELIRVGKTKHELTVVDQVNARNQLVAEVEKK